MFSKNKLHKKLHQELETKKAEGKLTQKQLLRLEKDIEKHLLKELKVIEKDQRIIIRLLKVFVKPFSFFWRKWQKRYLVRYKFNKKHLIMDSVILAGVLFLIGLNVFYLYGGFNYFYNRLEVNIKTVQENIVSGEEVVFKVDYINKNKFILKDVHLSFVFPEHFILKGLSNPDYEASKNVLNLGDLEPQANGSLKITGLVRSDIEKQQTLLTSFSFIKTGSKDQSLWGRFQKTKTFDYSVTESLVNLNLELPEKVIKQQIFQLPISFKNNSSVLINEYKVEPKLNEEFKLIKSDLELIDGAWRFYKINPGEEKKVLAWFKVETEEKKLDLEFNSYWRADEDYLKQTSLKQEAEVFDPNFIIKQSLDKKIVKPGEYLDMTLVAENLNGFDIENIQLNLDLDGVFWDLNNIKSDFKFNKVKDGLVWTEKEIERLALLQPQEKIEIPLKIRIKKSVSGIINPELRTSLNVEFEVEKQKVKLETIEKLLKVSSNLQVKAYGRYFSNEGDQLGRGPIPPKVGQETKYWLFLQVLNDLNKMENVKITATLPNNVVWLNKTNVPIGSPISYNSNNRTISWSINKVKVNPYNMGFAAEIALIPSSSQVGRYVSLLNNIKITGKDLFTGKIVTHYAPNITTNLVFDKFVGSKGVVVGE